MLGQIELPLEAIGELCRRWNIDELALFGSAITGDFRPDSDVDLLVRFDHSAHIGFKELDLIEAEFARLLGRPVDLIEREAIETSPNYLRRHAILDHMIVIYAS